MKVKSYSTGPGLMVVARSLSLFLNGAPTLEYVFVVAVDVALRTFTLRLRSVRVTQYHIDTHTYTNTTLNYFTHTIKSIYFDTYMNQQPTIATYTYLKLISTSELPVTPFLIWWLFNSVFMFPIFFYQVNWLLSFGNYAKSFYLMCMWILYRKKLFSFLCLWFRIILQRNYLLRLCNTFLVHFLPYFLKHDTFLIISILGVAQLKFIRNL